MIFKCEQAGEQVPVGTFFRREQLSIAAMVSTWQQIRSDSLRMSVWWKSRWSCLWKDRRFQNWRRYVDFHLYILHSLVVT